MPSLRPAPLLALTAAAALLLSSCGADNAESAPTETPATEQTVAEVPGWDLDEDGFQLNVEVEDGPEVIMYTDFQCPFCATASGKYEYVGRVLDGEANVKIKHFPLDSHRNAKMAARAVQAAGLQGSFETMAAKLYETQEQWGEIENGEELLQKFTEYALEVGIDGDDFARDINSQRVEEAIDAQRESGKELGVNGTPTFVVDGKILEDVDSGTVREQMVDRIQQAYQD